MKNFSQDQDNKQNVTAMSYSEKNKITNLKGYTSEVNEWGELKIKTLRPQKLNVLRSIEQKIKFLFSLLKLLS